MACFPNLLFFFLFSSATACDRCVHQSKATHSSDDSYPSVTAMNFVPLLLLSFLNTDRGACGYGKLALEFSNGYFAAVAPALYKQGANCGACYQVRCKSKISCNTEGTKVVLITQNYDTRTDFVLSEKAFSAMALKDKEQELLNSEIVDVEYKRIPCVYENKNLSVRVEESNYHPSYIAIKFLYQGGQTEIVAVDIAQVGSSDWVYLSRNSGATWETKRAPKGALQMRMRVTSGYDGKWVWAKDVLPADWKKGVIYDTKVQIDDIAKEGCSSSECGDELWK